MKEIKLLAGGEHILAAILALRTLEGSLIFAQNHNGERDSLGCRRGTSTLSDPSLWIPRGRLHVIWALLKTLHIAENRNEVCTAEKELRGT
jgi:hypothetical protein